MGHEGPQPPVGEDGAPPPLSTPWPVPAKPRGAGNPTGSTPRPFVPPTARPHPTVRRPEPEGAGARAWWDSPAYREIAPLRSRHIEGDIILVEGVPEGYEPTGVNKAMREALPAD
ncbi:DUF1330 domain-containing protein [Streptomyces incanus]|uniref:DUF1330 domain-containing protein n=1 Tax=Streptomyces incanus TaxID=887453 RepID=A0ABW0XJ65_9ACTN